MTRQKPMPKTFCIAVVSDVHYAADEERARCADFYSLREIKNPAARIAERAFHHFIWLRDHGAHNDLFDKFLAAAGQPDLVVANGDFSCNTAQAGLKENLNIGQNESLHQHGTMLGFEFSSSVIVGLCQPPSGDTRCSTSLGPQEPCSYS